MDFFDFLIPICVCVILPVLIVWMISRVRKNETDRRAEVMLKAIEAGVPIDPELFKKPEKSHPKNLKENLLDRLTGACITSFMGVAFLTIGIFFLDRPVKHMFLAPGTMVFAGGILLAVGIALFIVFFTGKKMLAKEIEAEEKHFTVDD